MARRIADLDARDYQARVDIRVQLRARRQACGWSQRKLGDRLGYDAANIRRLEREGVDQSFTVTVMRWARELGTRLVLTPVGFPPPAPYYRNMIEAMAEAMALAAPGEADDAAEVAGLIQQLVGIRLACRVTQPQLAKQFGTTVQNVSLIETAGSSTALVVLQRHARGIARCAWRPDAHLAAHVEDTPLV